MTRRPETASPTLDVAVSMIGDASARIVSSESEFNHTFEVEVEAVSPDPGQARRHIADEALTALAATLAAEGQLQPILVRRDPQQRGKWIIVAGERRWRAAKLLNWTRLLAMVHTGDAEVAGLIENLQRVDLAPVEEARGIQRLLDEKGWTQDRAAQSLGKPKSDISGTLGILSLPEEILNRVLTSEHPPAKNVLVELARITDPDALGRLADLARTGSLTIRAIRAARPGSAAKEPMLPEQRRQQNEWRIVRQAGLILSRMAASQTVISQDEAAWLLHFREVVDSLLGE